MREEKQKILNFVRQHGPIIPSQILPITNQSLLMVSAILSELSAQRQVLVTHTKRGGSPFYYVPGQEHKLILISANLSEKPKRAYELLKDKKVLRDKDLEPWQRVALREVKDFAIMLRVNYQDTSEIFWKWYMLGDEDVKPMIGNLLQGFMPQPEPKKEEVVEEKEIEKKVEEVVEEKEEIIQKEPEKIVEEVVEKEEEKVEVKERPKKESKPKKIRKIREKQVTLKEKESPLSDDFAEDVLDYMEKNKIKIIESSIIKKNSEVNFLVSVPSSLGSLLYYVNAKNKNKINEVDLTLAYQNGMSKKLPVLVLSPGNLTKKSQEFLDKNMKGYLTFKRIK